MRASTVHLPEAAFVELETLAGKSGKSDSNGLGLSETVRFGFQSRMVSGGNQRSFFERPEECGRQRGDIQRALFAFGVATYFWHSVLEAVIESSCY
jgi:hypothetical protein